MTEPLPLPLFCIVAWTDRVLIVHDTHTPPLLEVMRSLSDGAEAIGAHVAARLNAHPDMAETLRMVVREFNEAPEKHSAQQRFIAGRARDILQAMAECMPPDPEPPRIFSAFQTDRGREATPPFDDYIHPGGA